MLALITEGERNRPDATRASSSRSVKPVLHQAGVNVDGARQRDAVDRQFLIVDAISRKPGEQNSDQRNKPDDETQPNHSLTQTARSWQRSRSNHLTSAADGNKSKQQ